MRILVLASHGDSLINFRGQLLAAMVAQGHQLVVAAPNISDELERRLALLGARVRRYPLARTGSDPFADLRTLAALIALCADERPDQLIAYTIKPVVYGLIAAGISLVPRRCALITGLGYAFGSATIGQRLAGAVARLLYRLCLRQAQTVFFQNPDDRDDFVKGGLATASRSVVVNGSGVDLVHFAASSPPLRPVTFLLIARLIREKGIGEYAAAARVLRQAHPEARWLLAGPTDPNPSGVPSAELAAWSREGAIDYLGELEDVRPALARCSVYVLPSYYREGTPRTVLEALSCGRPVITTDMPGCRETVEDGVNGMLVPPRNLAALQAAMATFLARPQLIAPMGAASRALAERRYDVHAVNRRMLAALRLEQAPGECRGGTASGH
jgi:glycosyltransferase involved in cell wall biosynthesis